MIFILLYIYLSLPVVGSCSCFFDLAFSLLFRINNAIPRGCGDSGNFFVLFSFRELAIQIAEQFEALGADIGLRTAVVGF